MKANGKVLKYGDNVDTICDLIAGANKHLTI